MKYNLTAIKHGEHIFYGIKSKSIAINDISTDRKAMLELCKKLERGMVTETTVMDIIEDFME